MCFNNGLGRDYSSIDEITPPVDLNGNYTYVPGSAFGPENLTWTYIATPPASLFAHDISGAQRLQNGNTLIDDGPLGTFLEVTSEGDIVWKYINPVDNTGPLTQGDSIPHDPTHPDETLNSVFRVYRYPPDYPGFDGRDLTPGDVIELYPQGIGNEGNNNSSFFHLDQNVPNPVISYTSITYLIPEKSHVSLIVRNVFGQEIVMIEDETRNPGYYTLQFNVENLSYGIYFYTLSTGNYTETKRMMVIK